MTVIHPLLHRHTEVTWQICSPLLYLLNVNSVPSAWLTNANIRITCLGLERGYTSGTEQEDQKCWQGPVAIPPWGSWRRVEGAGLGPPCWPGSRCWASVRAPWPLSTISSATDWLPDAGNCLLVSSSFLVYERAKYLRCSTQQGHWVQAAARWCGPWELCVCAPSCPTLCNPMDWSPPGSCVHGLLQARILDWVLISYSTGSSPPRGRTCVSCIARQVLYHWYHAGPKATVGGLAPTTPQSTVNPSYTWRVGQLKASGDFCTFLCTHFIPWKRMIFRSGAKLKGTITVKTSLPGFQENCSMFLRHTISKST